MSVCRCGMCDVGGSMHVVFVSFYGMCICVWYGGWYVMCVLACGVCVVWGSLCDVCVYV